MSANTSSGPPPCEFHAHKLTLEVDLLVASKIEAISPVVERLMRLLKKTCCASKQEFAVETALREALANAIIHGNRQDPRKKVRVCCACQEDGEILIIVKDEGEGFDPTKVPSPLVGESVHLEHGRGMYLVNMLMDEVHLERGGREIYMRKGGSATLERCRGSRALKARRDGHNSVPARPARGWSQEVRVSRA